MGLEITPAARPGGSSGDLQTNSSGAFGGLTPGTGIATALGVNVGLAGAPVVNGGALGTPSSGTLTSVTGLPVSTGISGLGTGVAAALATANNTAGGYSPIDGTAELTNKTLTSSVGKGTWTASGTWTLPAHTVNGSILTTGGFVNSIGDSTNGFLAVNTNRIRSAGGSLDLNTGTATSLFGGAVQFALGKSLVLPSGTNTRAGNAVLVGGTVTVSNTTVTANTIVLLTRKTSGGTIGTAITYTLSAGTSFTITSDNILDTSTFSYVLIENP